MPYIKKDDRKLYSHITDELIDTEIGTKGDLEFLIFTLMRQYMSTREFRYSTLHDCVYAAQHCADEFRRRFLDKREDQAIRENGDIL